MKKLLLIFTLILLTACGKQLNEAHENYLESNGWHIKKEESNETYVLSLPEEILSNYDASGITFLKDYLEQQVTQTVYILKEKDTDNNSLKAIIFEVDGEIIGGYGVLSNWTPGIFQLADKDRLLTEEMIKQ